MLNNKEEANAYQEQANKWLEENLGGETKYEG